MGPPSAIDALAAAEGGQVDDRPVDHVAVIPVIGPRTEKDHGLAVGLVGILGEFPRYLDHVLLGTPVIACCQAGVNGWGSS